MSCSCSSKKSSNKSKRQIELKLLDPRAKPPEYATVGAGAVDLCAILDDPLKLYPGETWKVHTGLAISIRDPGLAAVILPRSGLSTKHGIKLANVVGLVDSDYQGEVIVAVKNDGVGVYTIEPGDRIAQMMFVPVEQVLFAVVDEFGETTSRGEGGFGSTGLADTGADAGVDSIDKQVQDADLGDYGALIDDNGRII